MHQWDEGDTRRAYDDVADTYADHFATVVPEAPVDLAMIAGRPSDRSMRI